MDEITFKEALEVFARTLREDKSMYYSYQSNIAMSFYDAVQEAGINFPQLHYVANKAAENFLNFLIKEVKTEKG